MEGSKRATQTWLVGPPDARKRACPVRGALGGNLLLQGSKAPSFDSIQTQAEQPRSPLREDSPASGGSPGRCGSAATRPRQGQRSGPTDRSGSDPQSPRRGGGGATQRWLRHPCGP